MREAAQRRGFEYFEPDFCSLFGEEEPDVSECSSPPASPTLTVDQEEEDPRDIIEVEASETSLKEVDATVEEIVSEAGGEGAKGQEEEHEGGGGDAV